MSVNKNELFEMINNLTEQEIVNVAEYVKNIQKKEEVLNDEAFNYVIDNFDQTIKGLVNRWNTSPC